MPFRTEIIEGHGWSAQIVISICKHCGWEVEDLENNIGVEWWGDEECGCHREAIE